MLGTKPTCPPRQETDDVECHAVPFHRWWSRQARHWQLRPWNQNQLMRRSDRIEGVTLILAVLAALFSVPVAGALGTAAYSAEAASIRIEHTSRTNVDAVIIAEPEQILGDIRQASLRWQAHDRARDAIVPVPPSAEKGDHLSLWVDADGAPSDAPRSSDAAAMTGVAVAVIVFAVTLVGGFCVVECTRRWFQRRNGIRWETEWRQIDSCGREDR